MHAIEDVTRTLRTGNPDIDGDGDIQPATCWTCKSPDVPRMMQAIGVDNIYSGGCVLKQYSEVYAKPCVRQPPSGGCVLKHLIRRITVAGHDERCHVSSKRAPGQRRNDRGVDAAGQADGDPHRTSLGRMLPQPSLDKSGQS